MAQGGERRMLFDIRGRRKHVVRVVYAILALLMGGSLFLVVGPVNLASLIGNSNSASSETTKLFQERAERIERELRKHPTDEDKQLALIRTRLQGGQAAAAAAEKNGELPGAESREEFEAATAAWDAYEKEVGKKKASPTVAESVAVAWFTLASNPTAEFEEAFESVEEAARVQKIYAAAKQTANAFSRLAAYQLITGNFKEGNVSGERAEELATSKTQREAVEKQLKELRKQGKQNLKAKKEIAKAEKGKGKEKLENPFGGLGGESAGTSIP